MGLYSYNDTKIVLIILRISAYFNGRPCLRGKIDHSMKLGVSGIEGSQTIGYFVPQLAGVEYNELNAAITEMDSANRSNPTENQWITIDEYNTNHGTDYNLGLR